MRDASELGICDSHASILCSSPTLVTEDVGRWRRVDASPGDRTNVCGTLTVYDRCVGIRSVIVPPFHAIDEDAIGSVEPAADEGDRCLGRDAFHRLSVCRLCEHGVDDRRMAASNRAPGMVEQRVVDAP